MALFNQQSEFPTSDTGGSKKKKILFISLGGLAVAVVAALIAGFFAPGTHKNGTLTPQNSVVVNEQGTPIPTNEADAQITGGSGMITTKPYRTPTPIGGATPQYEYIPEPTVDINSLLPTKPVTPTPTPLPGPFFTANGKQNDLRIRLFKREDWDLLNEVQLVNARTTEVRVIGYTYDSAYGDSAFFSKDFSQVIFAGGSKTDYQNVIIYSIPQKKVVKDITLADIKRTLPALQIQKTATISQMMPSPDGRKVALSYGNTFNTGPIDAATFIVAIDLGTERMELLPARGLVKGWKDATTIEYEINTTPDTRVTQEVKVTKI